MPIHDLRSAFQDVSTRRIAMGHFNFSEVVVLKAVAAVARQLNVPVVVGVSEGEREFIGVRASSALVKSIRDEYGQPIFLNGDHTHSLGKAVEAAKAGFDLIVFDASKHPFEENVRLTRATVEAVKSINPGILVEGEIGYIGTSSAIHDSIQLDIRPLATPLEAKQFVEATGVDVLAPAVGTMHGMLKSMVTGSERKHIDVRRISDIKSATDVFLTLHGASGTDTAELIAGICAGLNLIHINTEVRLAWRQGLQQAFAEHPDEVTPYHLLPAAYEAVSKIVGSRLRTFSRMDSQHSAQPECASV
jgi:fructose-bisphosphate aldolase, class II